jgi:hypothetical protein
MSTPAYPTPQAAPAQPVPLAFLAPPPASVQPIPEQPVPAVQPQPLPQIQAVESLAPSVKIPEGGYAQRIVRVPMPQFQLEGLPEPWVEMRNPGLMATSSLDEMGNGLRGIKVGEDGEPTAGDTQVVLATMVRLLRRWCMWDATSEEDVPPLLPETITADMVQRAPLGVIKAIGAAFMELQDPR